jgi:hypothetical protein
VRLVVDVRRRSSTFVAGRRGKMAAMGAWGPGIFSDDLADDLRRDDRELLEVQPPDETHVLWLALGRGVQLYGLEWPAVPGAARARRRGVAREEEPPRGVRGEGEKLLGRRCPGSREELLGPQSSRTAATGPVGPETGGLR